MRIIHLAPGDPTEFFELGNRATQGGFFKFLVGLNKHFSQSPATMRPTFPLTFSMDADVLEQQLAQLLSQCCIGFTIKSFAARALKPNRNDKLGSASCRARGCQYASISVGAE